MKYGPMARRAALCCAFVGALIHPRKAIAEDYSTPDYYVVADANPYYASGSVTIVYSLANLSDVWAPETVVEFSAAPESDPSNLTPLGQVPVPALDPWAAMKQTVSLPLPGGLPVGTTYMQLTAQVNPAGGSGEVKTANNLVQSGFGAVVSSASPAAADLVVAALSTPASAEVGASISISDTVNNVGSGDAGEFTISYYLSDSSGTTTLTNHTVGELPVGGSSLESFSVTLPGNLAPATYTLTVQANVTGSVTESNTANNAATRSLMVTAAAGGSSGGTGSTGTPSDAGSSGTSGTGSTGSTSGTGASGTFRSDAAVLPAPTVARPLFHVPFLDPTFGTTVTRMTDASMAPSAAGKTTLGLRHEYSRLPALNANNTKMVVLVVGGADAGYYEVRDLASGALHYKLGAQSGDPEISWHPSVPDQLLYRTGNAVHVFHTDTGQDDTLMAFPQYYAISTREEGRPSDDWRYYAFLGFRDSSFSSPDIVVADLVAKKVVATWANAGSPDWVSMSPAGKYVVVQWDEGDGSTRVYDRDTLAYLRTAFSDHSHSDFAFNAAGEEVIVYQASSGSAIGELGCPNVPNGSPIASARLADGQKQILLGDCYDANWNPVIAGAFLGWDWFALHFSGIASRAHPGWVLTSTYTTPGNAQQPFAREVFWLKLDGSGTVRRIAHHHSDQDSANGDKDYWAEPHASSSWDGSVVVFASVWDQPFQHYDFYTVTGQWW